MWLIKIRSLGNNRKEDKIMKNKNNLNVLKEENDKTKYFMLDIYGGYNKQELMASDIEVYAKTEKDAMKQAIKIFKDEYDYDPEENKFGLKAVITSSDLDEEIDTKELDETLPETFEGKIDFLAADEEEAIEGYDKVLLALDGDEYSNVRKQLEIIRDEEVAHKEFLEKVKSDLGTVYVDPNEDKEEDLEEAVSQSITIYEKDKDGVPEVGREFIAYASGHRKHGIFRRVDKSKWEKESDAKDHISSDGEFYAEVEHGWIYSINFDSYAYVDELGLKSSSVSQKETSENEAKKVEALSAFKKVFGDKYAEELLNVFTTTKDNRFEVILPFSIYKGNLDINHYSICDHNDCSVFIKTMLKKGFTEAEAKDLLRLVVEYTWTNRYTNNKIKEIKSTSNINKFIDNNATESYNDKELKEEVEQYKVIKTKSWYDPEGLDIPNNSGDLMFTGSKEECLDFLKNTKKTLIGEYADRDDITVGPIQEKKKLDSTYFEVYFMSAIAKNYYQVVKANGEKNESLKEKIEKQPNVDYKGFTIEHFPIEWHYNDKVWDQDGYIIHSPYYLQNNSEKPKIYLPLYCEDEYGEVLNFKTLDDAKNYIDDYILPKKGKIKVKRDECHFELLPEYRKEKDEEEIVDLEESKFLKEDLEDDCREKAEEQLKNSNNFAAIYGYTTHGKFFCLPAVRLCKDEESLKANTEAVRLRYHPQGSIRVAYKNDTLEDSWKYKDHMYNALEEEDLEDTLYDKRSK